MFYNLKKSTFFLLFFSFSFAQIQIEGKIKTVDNEPIFGANVYLDGTTIGTTSDEDGSFVLQLPSQSNATLVISYFGFKTVYNQITSKASLQIILEEDVKTLKEVVLKRNYFSRKQMMSLFKNQFLGNNSAARKCTIKNENDIYFEYDAEKFVLYAHSDVPLKIKNEYLGYEINYDLNSFECKLYKLSIKPEAVISNFYAGTSQFIDIDSSVKNLKRRTKSFEGSIIHFFRNLVLENWGKEQFLLFEGSYQTDPKSHFTIKKLENGLFQIDVLPQEKGFHTKGFVAEFSILFDKREQSKILFYTPRFLVDAYGLYTEFDKILFSGEITEKRVANLLPSNYEINK